MRNSTIINGPAVFSAVAIGLSGLPASALYHNFGVTMRNEGRASLPSLIAGINTSKLGKINLFVGYGVDGLDILQNQRYRYVHTLNG